MLGFGLEVVEGLLEAVRRAEGHVQQLPLVRIRARVRVRVRVRVWARVRVRVGIGADVSS